MQIYELVISPEREEHIAAHHVKATEVEEVVFGRPYTSRARDQRYRLIGQTEAERYLTVFLAPKGHNVYGLVTARDATQSERRLYQERRRP
ncbi:MAG TPA: hypothetical protein VKT82_06665 [Ktedonobacterales bacterium]|nr:hypothetical protein [Ktedonobacterales bacterium]